MRFGVVTFPADYAVAPAELARAVQDAGFESLFFPEHTHIPASRETPYPAGGELPLEYSHTYDPFVALSQVAAVTSTLRFGTAICLVTQREPILLAKQVASLDALSGGRFVFGVGQGWNREEMRDHGTDPATRLALMRERIAACRALWTEDEATFHGRFTHFDRAWSWPKPAQAGGPPVLVGGAGPTVLERVVEYGDGWLPIGGRGERYEDWLAGRIDDLRLRAEQAGRDPIPVTLYGGSTRPEAWARYEAMGVERLLFSLPPAPAEVTLPKVRELGKSLPG